MRFNGNGAEELSLKVIVKRRASSSSAFLTLVICALLAPAMAALMSSTGIDCVSKVIV